MLLEPGRKFAKLLAGPFIVFAAVLVACARDSAVIPLIPAPNWSRASSEALDVDAVSRWGGDPTIDRDYGVKSLQSRTYQLATKLGTAAPVLASVVLEEASDPSAAYGLLTYYRTERMAPEKGVE